MPPLTSTERDAFLDQPGILCRIATVEADGAPHVTPVWFIHEDGAILITPRAESSWLAHIRHEPRVALTIDDQAHPYNKVTVQGTAELLHDLGEDDTWRDLYRRIARRYVAADGADSIAVITDFFTHPDPEARVRQWLAWAATLRT